MYSIIEKKRDKKELSYSDLKFFIDNYCQDKIFDDQAAALMMAIFLNGMTEKETANLTEIMSKSGDMIDLSKIKDTNFLIINHY